MRYFKITKGESFGIYTDETDKEGFVNPIVSTGCSRFKLSHSYLKETGWKFKYLIGDEITREIEEAKASIL